MRRSVLLGVLFLFVFSGVAMAQNIQADRIDNVITKIEELEMFGGSLNGVPTKHRSLSLNSTAGRRIYTAFRT